MCTLWMFQLTCPEKQTRDKQDHIFPEYRYEQRKNQRDEKRNDPPDYMFEPHLGDVADDIQGHSHWGSYQPDHDSYRHYDSEVDGIHT